MADNIVLIGFMGVGKGQVGRALADRMGLFVVDCDDLIESATNMKIKKIFSTFGEDTFRRKEQQLALWLEENVSKTIISTGGGFVNVPNLSAIDTIVYLHDEFDDIVRRIQKHPNAKKKIKKRPLLEDMKKAKKLYKDRLPLYSAAADITVTVQGKKPEKTAKGIADLLNSNRWGC